MTTPIFPRLASPRSVIIPVPGVVPAPDPDPPPTITYSTPKVAWFKYSNGTSATDLTTYATDFARFKWICIGWNKNSGSISGYNNGVAALRSAADVLGNTDFKVLGYVCLTEVGTPGGSSGDDGSAHTTPAPLWDSGIKPYNKVITVQSDGYDWINRVRSSSTVSITRSSTTATVSHTSHGYSSGNKILIYGAVQTDYNGVKTITVVDANSYTYTVSGSPATPATGTIYAFTNTIVNGNPGTNYTANVAADSNGRRYPQWFAGYMDWCAESRMSLNFDGWFLDNTHYYGGTADWDHNPATSDTQINATLGSTADSTTRGYARAGHRAFIDAIRTIYGSGFILVGNGQPNNNADAVDFHQSAEIDEQLNGVLYEGVKGETYSDWTQKGWSVVLANVNTYQESTTGTDYTVLTWNNCAPTDYKYMRCALCCTLMTNAYAFINNGYNTIPTWYDEYNADLGAPVDPVPSAPLTANVWGRKYENGYVLVNVGSSQVADPGTSTTYTGLPAGIYKRLTGTQDATVNSGATVTGAGINIPAWDGRVLLCVTPGVHS